MIGLSGKDVTFRICRNAVYGIEFARLASSISETRLDLERFAVDDVNLLVGSIARVKVLLLRIL